MEADETMVVAGERRHCWSASCGGWRRPVFAQARVWMSRDSPRATTTTIGLRGLHCCPSFVTGFALAHRVLTDQALYLAALRQRHVLQLGESSAAADGSCTFKVLCCLSAS
ncbi:uncharacterized protein LOC124672154 [Lolium rigidum]|uniref:uncharacterized protein LOC124672154 n=1 Tax=Lolium rigidum TaxID=89674 RepID=UPI001F5DF0A9|nr:uncharacterized protein LOC124672154 [Lolium rigidum]